MRVFPRNIRHADIYIASDTVRQPVALALVFGGIRGCSAVDLRVGAASTPIQRRTFGEASLPRVRAGHAHDPGGARAAAAITRDRPARGAAARRVATRHARLRGRAAAAGSTSRARALARLPRAARRGAAGAAVAADAPAIPKARVQEHFSILLDGFAVRAARYEAAEARAARPVTKVYPSLRYTARWTAGRRVIGATAFAAADRREGRGDQDRRRRQRRRPDEPVPHPTGFAYPPGFPQGRHEEDDAEGDRRSVFPGAGAGQGGHARPSTRPSRTGRTCRASRRASKARRRPRA